MKDFIFSDSSVLLDFRSRACKTFDEVLNSKPFNEIVLSYINRIDKINTDVYKYLKSSFGNTNIEILDNLTKFLIGIVNGNMPQLKTENKNNVFDNINLLLDFEWDLYDYWRHFERFVVVADIHVDISNGENFADNTFSSLILSLHRKIRETIIGSKNKIYRQLQGGANFSFLFEKPEVKVYDKLNGIDFVKSVVLRPPFFTSNRGKIIHDLLFEETFTNPLDNININTQEWICLPLKISDKIAFVYFHIDFVTSAVALTNLFEIADKTDFNEKPDLVVIYGANDSNDGITTTFYQDKEKDIIIGFMNNNENIEYVSHLKRMLLTIFNIKILNEGKLPVRGLLGNFTLQNGKTFNIVIVGDNESGKKEVIKQLNTLLKPYSKYIRKIFSDIGYLSIKDNVIYGSGTETGGIIKIDNLKEKGEDVARVIDRGIFINTSDGKVRIAVPNVSFNVVNQNYKIDYLLYANNYEEGMEYEQMNDKNIAKQIFMKGQNVNIFNGEKKEILIPFYNKYGASQREGDTANLLDKFLQVAFESKIKVAVIRTGVMLRSLATQQPINVAKKLFDMILYDR